LVMLQLRRVGLFSRILGTSRKKSFEPPVIGETVNPNVEVTGAARLYRAASGGPQGWGYGS
jgi:hypothetical protein